FFADRPAGPQQKAQNTADVPSFSREIRSVLRLYCLILICAVTLARSSPRTGDTGFAGSSGLYPSDPVESAAPSHLMDYTMSCKKIKYSHDSRFPFHVEFTQ
ncbi:MAG: hypothetical protein J6Z30_00890, partial [Pyramidobacter sp.]|nr:hypothetical protein [Pyramidobacter sp.]